MEPTPPHTDGAARTMVDGPDLRTYRAVHAAQRQSAALLADALSGPAHGARPQFTAGRAAALARWFDGLATTLVHHHRAEDDILFPALAGRVPEFSILETVMTGQHHHLDVAIDTVRRTLRALTVDTTDVERATGAAAAAVALRDHLDTHLDVEDRDVLPLFAQYVSAVEFAELDERVAKSIGLRATMFMLPWFLATAPPDAVAAVMADAPWAIRLLARLTRRRYARLVATAFGDDRKPEARP